MEKKYTMSSKKSEAGKLSRTMQQRDMSALQSTYGRFGMMISAQLKLRKLYGQGI
jgi:hypothetical protein